MHARHIAGDSLVVSIVLLGVTLGTHARRAVTLVCRKRLTLRAVRSTTVLLWLTTGKPKRWLCTHEPSTLTEPVVGLAVHAEVVVAGVAGFGGHDGLGEMACKMWG